MNIISVLFAHLNLATALSLITAIVIPYLAALVTKAKGWWTGTVTLGLSALSGFLSEAAASGSHYDWRAGLGTFLLTWATAALYHSKVLSGTPIEAALHAVGTKTTTTAPAAPATTTGA